MADNLLTMLCLEVLLGLVLLSSADSGSGYRNVAPGGYARASSSKYGGIADLALDGNRSGHFSEGSCTYSGADEVNKWSVMLRHSFINKTIPIDHVLIYNRLGNRQKRIHGAKVGKIFGECVCFSI